MQSVADRFELSLRLRHSSTDLRLISTQLGLEAKAGWDVGQPNRKLTGEIAEGVREFSYRSFQLAAVSNMDLQEAISMQLDRLAFCQSEIASFVRLGGTAAIAVGWFCGSSATGAALSSTLLGRLHDFGFSLDFYVYGPQQSQ